MAKMTDEELWQLFILMHKPIPWDPVPVWAHMTEEQMHKYVEIQTRFNAQMAKIQEEKIQALAKVANIKMM